MKAQCSEDFFEHNFAISGGSLTCLRSSPCSSLSLLWFPLEGKEKSLFQKQSSQEDVFLFSRDGETRLLHSTVIVM